jgi:predicted RNase H-like HicB family nuclease
MPESALTSVLGQQVVHIRIFEDPEDGGFVAECIEIPGCMSQGETRSEALANVMGAVSACLEVIAEDAGVPISGDPLEYVELPISQFLNPAR